MHLDISVYIFVFNLNELITPSDVIVEFSEHSCSELQKNVPVFRDLVEMSKFLPVIESRKNFKIATISLYQLCPSRP